MRLCGLERVKVLVFEAISFSADSKRLHLCRAGCEQMRFASRSPHIESMFELGLAGTGATDMEIYPFHKRANPNGLAASVYKCKRASLYVRALRLRDRLRFHVDAITASAVLACCKT